MFLKLMYITNNSQIARIAEDAGVDRIFVDLEYIGKKDRQGGMDTVQSHHTIDDVAIIRDCLKKAELLVRCNPIHDSKDNFGSSEDEIEKIINNGAQIIMLPYFKSIDEVKSFLNIVKGRAKTCLLIETAEAVDAIDEILALDGIDEVFIGLNDLSLSYNKKFMFELLSDATVEKLCLKFRLRNIPYGFGGVASLGQGLLPAERIIVEHYRLGSKAVILSRTFCNTTQIKEVAEVKKSFEEGIAEIRAFEKQVQAYKDFFDNNLLVIKQIVKEIVH